MVTLVLRTSDDDQSYSLSAQDSMIPMNINYLVLAAALVAVNANADNSTLDAAIGGGLGGAAGAAIGNEVGGRNGAIIGGALGGATGAAVTTDNDSHHSSSNNEEAHHYYYHPEREYPASRFCPPGQAKKGRC
jgi:outer membrane lipoprotein SlyB